MRGSKSNLSLDGVRRAPEMARATNIRACGGSQKRILLFLAPLLALWGMVAVQSNAGTEPLPAGITRTQLDLMEAQSDGQDESVRRLFYEVRQRSLSAGREALPKQQIARTNPSS
jgi:hypothetical protein